ncbi:2736_t:CDS:2, partial [Funneliformis geosporum]
NSLQDLTDAETYQKIKAKVVLEFLGDDQVEGDDTSIPFIENQTEKYQKTWQEAIDFICSIYEHRLIFRVITDEPMKFKYIDKNLTDKSLKIINLLANGEKFSKHFFEDYAEDGQIAVEGKLTGDLAIQDYPNLAEINLVNHELTSLTITNCPNLKEINLRHNQLTKLEINDHNKIEQIIAAQDYEELKIEKEELLGVIKNLKEGGEEGKLMLTEAIESSDQVEEAIQNHLQKTEQE